MAGMPRGVLQVLPGDGPSVGEPLGASGRGHGQLHRAPPRPGGGSCAIRADSNLKKVTLECGGKNPAVVLSDAENLDHVAEHVVNAAFWNMGENCSAQRA